MFWSMFVAGLLNGVLLYLVETLNGALGPILRP